MLDGYDVKRDDLPLEFRRLADEIGLEAALELVRLHGGEGIYIPKVEKVTIQARNRAIRAEFDGSNYRELAQRHKLSVVWVRQVVAGRTDGGLSGVDVIDKQRQLF